MLNKIERSLGICIILVLVLGLFLTQITSARASDLALTSVNFALLAGNKLQIQFEMNGAAVKPEVFQTDNPARIALDFSGVKNALNKKTIPVNQGVTNSIYIAEAADRLRIVVNLNESIPFETKVLGNKVLLILTPTKTMASASLMHVTEKPKMSFTTSNPNSVVTSLIPEQIISGFDFKRGDKSEARIIISLANPNTVVNSKQEGGKVVINLLNTRLPENMAKRLDVSEFATPIKFIDTTSSNRQTTVTVTTQNDLYDYSLFQSQGLLTIEFRPLSTEEKEALDRTRVKYSGDRLSLNFQEIEIRSVIAILAEFTGQNVVAGDDVNGTITLKLDDVPWDEALDFIMMTKGLEKFESGNVTLIAPVGKIKDYKEQQQETATVIEQLDPLVTEYIKINYARAENFRNLLNGLDTGQFGSCGAKSTAGSSAAPTSSLSGSSITQSGQGSSQSTSPGSSGNKGAQNDELKILSSRGSAVVDARTNTLIVRETTKRLEEAKKLIRKLDVPVRQVMIESRIVIASSSFAQELGVRFGVAGNNVKFGTSSGTVGSVNPVGGTVGSINGTAIVNDALVDLAAAGIVGSPPAALGMTLARGADYVLNLELSALQDQGRGELVSNPRVMTTDRCNAKIKQGKQIPYQSSSANTGTNTQFVDALLELDVLPQITPSGSISMTLNITKDEPEVVVIGQPPITKRQVETTVQVMDGETVVLGGVFEGTLLNNTSSVPFFADLPVIGFLFKKTYKQDDKKELLIFITPKIIKDNAASN
ncbi:type IV pilus secretin family protein [Methylobacter sp. S3L5C]|uniref:type IV pilus secretin family protein n=1 Tax=Methylobacter sp. S3L5C TaxID=2839024 RepID=UPI001FACADBA|nr:type IV pilus secretin family protein [Methylobacter sp. S3L5C]UOA07545.1 type IV pilus secretin PilQ [Methylobacter sp. S3L5C]